MTPADLLADVAAIDGAAGDGTSSAGSGRLIAPGLILTAAHVVAANVATWRVVLLRDRLSDGTWTRAYAAKVVFSGAGTLDLALLRISNHRPPEPRLRHLHVAYDDLGELEVQAAGFPDARRAPNTSLRDYRVFGRLRVATAGAPYSFSVEQADKPDVPEGWRGFSGSAVVWIGPDQRLNLFGVAQRVPDNFTLGGQLDVARLADAHDYAQFCDALRQSLGAVPSWVRWRKLDTSLRSPPIRGNILPAQRRFIGRAASLDAIGAALGDTRKEAVVVLRGQPGVGKSGLAEEYARRHQPSYPGGTFLLDAAADAVAVNLANLGRGMLRFAIDVTLSPADQAIATLLHLATEPTLLIYDNIQSERDIRPFLPRAGTPCHVIITTLLDRWDEDCVLAVRPLTDDEAYTLVEDRAGSVLAARHGRDIVAAAGGLPVQLNTASRAVSRAAERGLLDGMTATLTTTETESSFQAAYNLLAPESRLLLHAAAHLNSLRINRDLLRGHLREGAGWLDTQFAACLNACFDLHLLDGGEELRMHQLFAAFLNEREDRSGLAEPLTALVKAEASRLIAIARDVVAQPNRLDLASLLTIYPLQPERWVGQRGQLSVAEGEIIGRALYETGFFAAAQPWFERAVAEAEQGDVHGRVDHASLGSSLHLIGYCLSSRGEFAAAQTWFERAVAQKEQGDVHGRVDHASLGSSLHQVGFCLSSRGEFAAAQPWFERAVAQKEQGDVHGRVDHESLGRSLHEVGSCLSSRGEFAAAQTWFERAVAEAEQGDVHGRVDHAQLLHYQNTLKTNLSNLS
jgi:tetratricopeptide (TPR) repeat protein